MSDVPTTSDILNFNGQPMSPEAAGQLRAERLADPKYAEAARNGDMEKARELAALWQLERGREPATNAPQDVAGVVAQMSEREMADNRRRVDTWAGLIQMTPERRAEIERMVATEENVAAAKRELERMKRDDVFRRKVLANDMDAVDRWSRMNLIASMRPVPADYKHPW